MAKLPLITVVAPESGPVKIAAVPKTEGGDSKAYFDSSTGKVVVDKLIVDSLNAGILKTDVDGNVSSNTSIGHGEVDGLGNLALLDSVDLADGEVTGVLGVDKGGTGKSNITAGSLLLGAGTGDMTELVGTVAGQVVKWNASTETWYAGAGGGGGGGSVDSVTGTSPITVDNTDPANPVVELDQTAIEIANTQVTGLGSLATKSTVDLTADVTDILPAGNGGTGLSAPVSGDVGKVLTAKSDGTYELTTPAAAGVTDVTASGVLSSSGGTTPDITLTGTVGLGNGGTGSASNTGAAGKILVGNGSSAFVEQTMGGDATINSSGSVTVAKIQGNAVATGTPANGQILTWSSALSQWVPGANSSGGSGGGGVTLFFNNQTSPTTPVTNLPTGTKQMGRNSTDTLNSIGPVALTKDAAYLPVASFVTDHTDKYTTIAAGLWDFNVWVQGDTGQSATQTQIRLRIFAYDESTDPTAGTAIGISDDVYMYDPSVSAQYPVAVKVAQTTLSPAQRLYVDISARTTTNNRNVTVFFGGNEASHVHTTIPSVTGTGLYKLVDGVPQSPASYLINSDVAEDAGIAQSKISGLVDALNAKADDNAVVKLTGTQSIDGVKTFTSAPVVPNDSFAIAKVTGLQTALDAKAADDTVVKLTGAQSVDGVKTFTSSPVVPDDSFAIAKVTGLQTALDAKAADSAVVKLTGTQSIDGVKTFNSSPVVPNDSFTIAKVTSLQAALDAKAADSAVVKLTGAQTIDGNKTFSGEVTLSNAGQTASTVLKLDANKKVISGLVSNSDVASDAAIARDKLAAGSAASALIINNASTKKFDELAISATAGHVLKSDGSAATWGQLDLSSSNSVTGILPIANGGTGVGTGTNAAANTVFAAPNGSAGTPSFRLLATTDIPSLSAVYLPLSGGTMTGKLTVPASTTTTAGLNIGNGAAPTSPVNGDIWASSTQLRVQIAGTTQSIPATGSNNTFSASSSIYSNGVNTGTVELASGATLSGSTKTVNIGTFGVAGSTTNITIGATAGTSNTTLNGTVTATTAAVDTSTTQVATTAYVINQGYLKSATALSTYAPIASPTFTGTVTIPTGASIAGYLTTSSASSTYLAISNNLSELTSTASTARTNLGLGTMATQSSSSYAALASANSYTAGAKQTISQSVTTSGLNFGAVAGNPSSLATGDVWHNNTTNKLNYYSNATTNVLATESFVTTSYAPIASPTFTGTPAAPTPSTSDNSTTIATTAFVKAQNYITSTPYDISGEFVGTPATGATIMRFVATRAFTFGAANAYFACTSNLSGDAIFTVYYNGSLKGTITISSGQVAGNSSITSTSVSAGGTITVVAATPAGVVNPYWTLPGTV